MGQTRRAAGPAAQPKRVEAWWERWRFEFCEMIWRRESRRLRWNARFSQLGLPTRSVMRLPFPTSLDPSTALHDYRGRTGENYFHRPVHVLRLTFCLPLSSARTVVQGDGRRLPLAPGSRVGTLSRLYQLLAGLETVQPGRIIKLERGQRIRQRRERSWRISELERTRRGWSRRRSRNRSAQRRQARDEGRGC